MYKLPSHSFSSKQLDVNTFTNSNLNVQITFSYVQQQTIDVNTFTNSNLNVQITFSYVQQQTIRCKHIY